MATVLTKAGAVLLAKALAGSALTFTRGAFGDAAGHDAPSSSQIDNLTALLHEKMSLPIASFRTENGQLIAVLTVKNENVTAAFRIKEGGLFARDPETERETLYCYFWDGDSGDYMPVGNADYQIEYAYEMCTAISNAQNVTCIIDKTNVGVTRAEFEEHIAASLPHPNWDVVLHPEFNSHVATFNSHVNSTNPHPNWDVVLHPEFNSHVNSTNPHPNWDVKIKTASTTLLGGVKVGQNLYMDGDSLNAVAGDSDVESRLRQIEINQSNLYVLLEQAYGLGVQANLLMVENFRTLKATSTFEAGASIAADNSSTITVDDCSQARDGGYYVLTDGLACNQLVKVTAVERVNAQNFILTVTPKAKEKSTRDLGKLMRSSVTIKDNKAYGAGLLKTKRRFKNKTWKGTGTSNTDNLVFYFSAVDSAADFDGDWSVTSDGYFTLD